MTVFNRSSDVDATIAAPEVIAALQDTGQLKPADPFGQSTAPSNNPPAVADTSAAAPTNTPTAKSPCYRIRAIIDFGNGRRTASEVVITLGDKVEPYHVLSWQDDVELHSDTQRRMGHMMAILPELKQTFNEWIGAVTSTVESVVEKFVRPRRIQLNEAEDGAFSAKAIPGSAVPGKKVQVLPGLSFVSRMANLIRRCRPVWQAAFRGSRAEVQLRPDHVMVSQLDFPSKAGDFLDGMIRAQIDRLTPWTANDAVFGWNSPAAAANDRST